MPINILCNNLSLYEYRGNLYLIQDLRKINVLKKVFYVAEPGFSPNKVFFTFCIKMPRNLIYTMRAKVRPRNLIYTMRAKVRPRKHIQ